MTFETARDLLERGEATCLYAAVLVLSSGGEVWLSFDGEVWEKTDSELINQQIK